MKRAISVAILLVALTPPAAFILYARHMMASPFIARLKRGAVAYPCIGDALDPRHRVEHPDLQIARFYFLDGRERAPSLTWHLQFLIADRALLWSTDRRQANRMFAALPMLGHWGDFDRVALTFSGKRYCGLDAPHRQAIVDFFRGARVAPLERAFGRRAPA